MTDLAAADLSSRPDLGAPPDLLARPDLALETPDLGMPDLASQPPDLAAQPDLAPRVMVWTMEMSNAIGAADLVQIWGSGAADVWIAGRSIGGEDPAVLRSIGDGIWKRIAVPTPSDTIFGHGGEVWLQPSWRSLDHGTTWLHDRTFPGAQPCATSTWIYAGDSTGFWRSNSGGVSWIHLFTDVDFVSTKIACDEGRAFAIGNTLSGAPDPGARITVFDSGGFHATFDFHHLHFDGAGASSGAVFVVGHDDDNHGILIRSLDDGEHWSSPATISPLPLNAVWADSASDVYIAGYHAALHGDGAAFAPIGVDGSYFSVWGSGPDDVYFAGEFARIAHGRR